MVAPDQPNHSNLALLPDLCHLEGGGGQWRINPLQVLAEELSLGGAGFTKLLCYIRAQLSTGVRNPFEHHARKPPGGIARLNTQGAKNEKKNKKKLK